MNPALDPVRFLLQFLLFMLGILALMNFTVAIAHIWLKPVRRG